MRFITIAIFLIPLKALAINCEKVNQHQYEQIVENLVSEGKGVWEINDILQARMDVCLNRCNRTQSGLCMLQLPTKKK